MNGKRTQHDNDASRFIPLPDPDALAADQRVRSLGEPIAAATCSARPPVAHLCRVAHCPKVVSYLRYCGRAGRTAAIAVFDLTGPGSRRMVASTRTYNFALVFCREEPMAGNSRRAIRRSRGGDPRAKDCGDEAQCVGRNDIPI